MSINRSMLSYHYSKNDHWGGRYRRKEDSQLTQLRKNSSKRANKKAETKTQGHATKISQL